MRKIEKLKWARKSITIFLISLIGPGYLCAQEHGKLEGRIIDTVQNIALSSASIILTRIKDSSILQQTISQKNGIFRIDKLPLGDSLLLQVNYSGYQLYKKKIFLTSASFDIGEVILSPFAKELQGVTIFGQRTPITVKTDTIEFNTSSFKTPSYAIIEDLLKKLPGLEVDVDGNLHFNGKKISKVLVDGQEFFGKDPKMATRNLPTDIVDKIQIMDAKSVEQLFSGRPGDGEEKTLNIKLKKGTKRFGNLTAGLGSDKRYEISGIINNFQERRQLSVLVASNNINKMGFGSEGGHSLSLINASNGITKSISGGINFSESWKEDIKLNGSYFYNNAFTDKSFHKERRQYIVADTSFFTASQNNAENRSSNHQLNFTINIPLSENATLVIEPNILNNHHESININANNTKNNQGYDVNSSESYFLSKGTSSMASANIFWGQKFKKQGRNFTLSFVPTFNKQKSDDSNLATNVFYFANGSDSTALQDQKIQTFASTSGYAFSFSYTEPISKSLQLVLNENIQISRNESERKVFNMDSTGYGKFDSTFSSAFSSQTFNNNAGLSFAYIQHKWQFTLGATTILTNLSNKIHQLNSTLRQKQFNYAPSANLNYKLKENKNLRLSFSAVTRQPSLDQLQPIPDNTNPFISRIGNPNLQPSFSVNYNLNYSVSNPLANVFFNNSVRYAPVKNAFISAIRYDSLGRQLSYHVNVNGTYSANLNMTVSKSWNKMGSRKSVNLNFSGNHNKRAGYVNDLLSFSRMLILRPSLGFHLNHKDILDFNISYNPRFTSIRYDKSSANRDFQVHSLRGSFLVTMPKNIKLENHLVYNYNSQSSPGFKKDAILWNLNAYYDFLKDKKGYIRFTVYDLLKQNNNIQRTVADNYIEDTESVILQQYFMLSLVYKMNFKVKN